MKSLLTKLLTNEIILYLFFGVATTLVYMTARIALFPLIPSILVLTLLANSLAIAFAFVTNDRIVFKQKSKGWFPRLVKFISARLVTLALDMALAYILVEAFPQIIGSFVHHNPSSINAIATLIAQVLVILLNYILSKMFVFTETQK